MTLDTEHGATELGALQEEDGLEDEDGIYDPPYGVRRFAKSNLIF